MFSVCSGIFVEHTNNLDSSFHQINARRMSAIDVAFIPKLALRKVLLDISYIHKLQIMLCHSDNYIYSAYY